MLEGSLRRHGPPTEVVVPTGPGGLRREIILGDHRLGEGLGFGAIHAQVVNDRVEGIPQLPIVALKLLGDHSGTAARWYPLEYVEEEFVRIIGCLFKG
jgi:hypothetical protein